MSRKDSGEAHHAASPNVGVSTPGSSGGVSASLALQSLPRSTWLLTAAHADRRSGLLIDSVIVCGFEPALICVAARKGHPIEPLIRDSHRFAICAVDPADRVLLRRFSAARSPEEPGDLYDGVGVQRLVTGAPILAKSSIVLDCDVHRHLDIECDQQLYIGLVLAGHVNSHMIIPSSPPDFHGED